MKVKRCVALLGASGIVFVLSAAVSQPAHATAAAGAGEDVKPVVEVVYGSTYGCIDIHIGRVHADPVAVEVEYGTSYVFVSNDPVNCTGTR